MPPESEEIYREIGRIKYPLELRQEEENHRNFCEKYDLKEGALPDPDKSYDELAGTDEKPKFEFTDAIFASCISVTLPTNENNKISIEIDLAKVNSLKALKGCVSELIEMNYNAFVDEKSQKYKFNPIDVLTVGNMKNEKKKNQEIAQKVFPRQCNPKNEKENTESAIRKVSHYYKRYKELINGGYRNLTFP